MILRTQTDLRGIVIALLMATFPAAKVCCDDKPSYRIEYKERATRPPWPWINKFVDEALRQERWLLDAERLRIAARPFLGQNPTFEKILSHTNAVIPTERDQLPKQVLGAVYLQLIIRSQLPSFVLGPEGYNDPIFAAIENSNDRQYLKSQVFHCQGDFEGQPYDFLTIPIRPDLEFFFRFQKSAYRRVIEQISDRLENSSYDIAVVINKKSRLDRIAQMLSHLNSPAEIIRRMQVELDRGVGEEVSIPVENLIGPAIGDRINTFCDNAGPNCHFTTFSTLLPWLFTEPREVLAPEAEWLIETFFRPMVWGEYPSLLALRNKEGLKHSAVIYFGPPGGPNMIFNKLSRFRHHAYGNGIYHQERGILPSADFKGLQVQYYVSRCVEGMFDASRSLLPND